MRKTRSVTIVLRTKVQEKMHKRSVTSLCPAGDQGQDVQAKPVMLGDCVFCKRGGKILNSSPSF